MTFSRHFWLVPLLLIGACSGQSSDKQGPPPGPPQVGVIVVKQEPVTISSELPGRTVPYESAPVRPQVTGLILSRLFEEGQQVTRGQALYRLDPQPYIAEVASARAALARSRASIASTAALARRYGELVKINAIARQDYENAITAAQQARADVSAQQAALNSAQINLARATITAPISGRIGVSLATAGALVSAGQVDPLTTIQRLDPIYVDISQSSTEVLRLRQRMMAGTLSGGGQGTRVRLKLEDGSLFPIEGTLQFTDVSVDEATGSQTLRARFANPRGLLLPGMYVRAEVIEGTEPAAILVPQRAVTRDEKGRPTVLVVGPEGKLAPRMLTASRTVGPNWLVTSGLKPGDKVVVEGAAMLRPGTSVKAVRWNPNAKPAAPASPAAAE